MSFTRFYCGELATSYQLACCCMLFHYRTGAELTIRYRCFFMQPMEAVLLLISSPAFGELATTLAFSLKANVSHITPTVSTTDHGRTTNCPPHPLYPHHKST